VFIIACERARTKLDEQVYYEHKESIGHYIKKLEAVNHDIGEAD